MTNTEAIEQIKRILFNTGTYWKEERAALNKALEALHEKDASNKPLTLEQLKELHEPTPIWIVNIGESVKPELVIAQWEAVQACPLTERLHIVSFGYEDWYSLKHYGKTWLAYSHEPKEADQNG